MEIDAFLDESGSITNNFSSSCRYFTIVLACMNHVNFSNVKRKVRKTELQIINDFPSVVTEKNEVKAANLLPFQKEYVVRNIGDAPFQVFSIVADLKQVKQRLRDGDKNILYNFMAKYLFQDVFNFYSDISKLHIYFDNRTVKVTSRDTIFNYIKSSILENGYYSTNVEGSFVESENCPGVRVADYYSNIINRFHNYPKDDFIYNNLKNYRHEQHFPNKHFGS
ncbi:DUF3800 domain-containing protein [Lacticaseibacillus paracasei]|uniref:DUF3800 domain-containing protein n=1 Tax=Lacticaseibacillus paracasei NRIC 0644 TaxID=1435038 RepID=A0A0C9QBY2_LACPA|nr:DUF3800 domain-containing protein [Lacticaseibacillus paracasei]GAN36173.1 hypothetical protein LC0644_0762 [Lacticaseibacillus paracasei NRIC 0644]GAN40743.1 hypothetical protein LC1917_2620 [Lacticaseibacillus paracasei NRIC 1917]